MNGTKLLKKNLMTADETLTVALLMNYQMGAMEEDCLQTARGTADRSGCVGV